MKKFLIIVGLFLLIISPCYATTYYWIRADGIYSSMDRNGGLQPVIRIGEYMDGLQSRIGRSPDGGLTEGIARYLDNGKPNSFWGVTFYSYNILKSSGFRKISTQDPVRSIEIFNPEIRTLQGVGVGCTCKQIWDAHGRDCTIESINLHDLGFYYKVGSNYIYFVVTSTDHLDDNFQVSSIVIF